MASFGIVATAQEPGTIEGTVTNALSGEPLKKTRVSLRLIQSNSGDGSVGTTTDNSGRFVFDKLMPGRYVVYARHSGFVEGGKGARFSTTVDLGPGQKATDIALRLMPQGVIAGRVLDEESEPVQGAAVQCRQQIYTKGVKTMRGCGGANTNDRGEYRIYGLNPGKYYLSASAHNLDSLAPSSDGTSEVYSTIYYPNALAAEAAVPLEVTPGAELRGIDLNVQKRRAVRIRGVVADATGNPVPNAEVSIAMRDVEAHVGFANTRTDSKGGFKFDGVPPGSYVLMALLQDGVGGRIAGRASLEVGASSLDNVAVALKPTAELAGRVVAEGERPVVAERLTVILQTQSPGSPGGTSAQARKDGTFRVSRVEPDVYSVSVVGLSGGQYLKSVQIGGQDVTETSLDFLNGVPAAELTVVVSSEGGKIAGTVQDDQGHPVPGSQVVLIPEPAKRSQSRWYRSAAANKSGGFVLSGIPPGEYTLLAWEHLEDGVWMDPDFLRPYESRGERVSVAASGQDNRQIKAIPASESGGS